MELVNYDCRSGDIIAIRIGSAEISMRVLQTLPSAIEVKLSDEKVTRCTYKELRDRRAYYIARVEPLNRFSEE